MSQIRKLFRCTPDDVFDVLSDGWSFAIWVVGAARIRDVDEGWPQRGSSIHHSIGAWPLLLNDTTSVERIDAPHSLTLTVRAWPAGAGRVTLTCSPEGAHTAVTMTEEATAGPAKLLPGPLRDLALLPRNTESLRRLAYLAESRARQHQHKDQQGSHDEQHRSGSGDVAATRRPS